MKRNIQIIACLIFGGMICYSGLMVWFGSPVELGIEGAGIQGSGAILRFLSSTQLWLVNSFGVFFGGLGMILIGVLISLIFLRFVDKKA